MPLGKSEALERLETFSEREGLTREQLNTEIGLTWNASKWSRNLKSKPDAVVDDHELAKIRIFLEKHRFTDEVGESINVVSKTSSDHMYFSLLDFFGYSHETEIETKQLSCGLYILYRPSLKIPDMFTVGMVRVYEGKQSRALKVKETRIFKGGLKNKNRMFENEKEIKEFFEGYMIRKRRRYICIQRSISRDSPNFVIAVYNDEFVDNEGQGAKILSLGGIVFGTVGSRIYVSKVFLERCEDGIVEDDILPDLNYVTLESLKPSVRNYLRLNAPSDYFHVF